MTTDLSNARRELIAEEIHNDADAECTQAEIREQIDRLLPYGPPIEDLEAEVRRQFDATDVSIHTISEIREEDMTVTIADVDEQLTDGEAVVVKTSQTEPEGVSHAVVAGRFTPTDPGVEHVLGGINDASGWVWDTDAPEDVERFNAVDTHIHRTGVKAELRKVTEREENMVLDTDPLGTVEVVTSGSLTVPEELLPDAGGGDT